LVVLVDILVKLTGMNTDHCAKEKKDAYEMEKLKEWAVNQQLGEDAMLEKSLPEIYGLQMSAQKKMVQAAGGQQKWEALSEATKSEKQSKMIECVIQELGRGCLSFLIFMKSVSCSFLFGLAVDVIKISIQCRVDIWQWRSGGKNMISKAQFYLLTGTMTQFLRREIRQLLMEMKSHWHKSRL